MAKNLFTAKIVAAGAAVLLAAGLTVALWPRPAREPFYGVHQAGVATAAQKFAFVAAFDLTTAKADEVRTLFKTWTRAAAALSQGKAFDEAPASVPPADTGETLGYKPARLTFTFGVGPSLFDGRFGLTDRRPGALVPLPAFPGDQLNPQWCDGDLVVQVAADDFQTAYHAVHTLTRLAKGVAVPRWAQAGFQPGLEANPRGPGRNLQGFIDGTVNPDTTKPEAMDQVVWVDQGPAWMRGGAYLVVRRIRMFVETWDRTSRADQERTIGRDRLKGEPLATQAEDSHVRLARGAGVEKLLRRPFGYVNGLDARTGQWDSGLLFLAWMKDPGRQFVPMQTRLSSFDALNEYIQPVGNAVFAVFPGVAEGDYVGSGLFPSPSLVERIEALQSRLGALYGPLGRGDWPEFRTGTQGWDQAWKAQRQDAGAHAAAIEAAEASWLAAASAAQPDPAAVRAAQASLIRTLAAWEDDAKPQAAPSAASLEGLKAALADVQGSLQRHDAPGALNAFTEFQRLWTAREALVRSLDAQVYTQIELLTGQARRALAGSRPEAAPLIDAMSQKLGALSAPQAYSAWDAGLLLFREGLEALLVLAALVSFLGRTGQGSRKPWVWSGAALGLAASVGAAFLVSVALRSWMAASTPELVEGLVGLAAVALMLTVGAWLHGKAAVKDWNLWLKESMGKASNSAWALALLAFLAVLREGAETAVFLWAMAGSLPVGELMAGIAGGLLVLAVLGVVMIGFSRRLPLSVFFPAATALIYYLAVKILGQGLHSLQSAGWVSATPLGWGGAVDWLGFTPTWETGLPQLVLALVLLGATAASLHQKKAG
jgi:deferrochelatase/peroxidase EfeB